ncbi:hypothetical protein CEP51_016860 [Fusarium floridanum]|uniref:Uncharacterized protein n=1 Tax=Fusarium floridanum TaxID=1325733 RepID=A0A428NDU1_9HYPO|nr:hypothetical protein CEP51_016860 [Fusarium floridanum]
MANPEKLRLKRDEWPGDALCGVHDHIDTINDNTSKPSTSIACRPSCNRQNSFIITIINLAHPLYRRQRIRSLAST